MLLLLRHGDAVFGNAVACIGQLRCEFVLLGAHRLEILSRLLERQQPCCLIAFASVAFCGERTLQLIALLPGTHNLHLGVGELAFEQNDDEVAVLEYDRFQLNAQSLDVRLEPSLLRRPLAVCLLERLYPQFPHRLHQRLGQSGLTQAFAHLRPELIQSTQDGLLGPLPDSPAELARRSDVGPCTRIQPVHMRAAALFSAFKTSVEQTAATPDRAHPLVLVARALREILPTASEAPPPERLAEAFTELVDALCERDEGDDNGDGHLDPTEADALWTVLVQRMNDEYNRAQGGFARLMYGGTRPDTRRLLQLAFNRQQSFPGVLVTQSMVGREGLNLHRACRIVLLLHPEWNPGVVEQQIGRVDRLGSHWERLCTEAIAKGCAPHELPRIEIRPVIFKGTYDEKNWDVLRERWDDLRAQLHGVIIPHREAYPGIQELLDEINSMAPSFSPAPLRS